MGALDLSVLRAAVGSRPGAPWLAEVLTTADPPKLVTAFAWAPRKVPPGPLEEPARSALAGAGASWLAEGADYVELSRVLLLARACELAADPTAVTAEWYRAGDNAEKRAVLRTLALLPGAARHVEVGVNACRSSVQSVFEAIACENPYPAAFFSELAWNQMVLKALFTGVLLERISGLDERKNSELARMAAGYASERRAAGRTVPADIDRVTT